MQGPASQLLATVYARITYSDETDETYQAHNQAVMEQHVSSE